LKTLTKLALVSLLGLGSLRLSSQNYKSPYSKNPFEFIPKGAVVKRVTLYYEDSVREGLWYDKDCKTNEDYISKLKTGEISLDKIFLDLNGDGIPDLSAAEFNKVVKVDKKS
jgi:hypothetical protein